MIWRNRHAQEHRDLLQAHVPDRVLAAGWVRAADGTASWPAPDADAEHRRARVTPGVWLAVSPTRLYAFVARDGRVGDLLEVWDRDATTVTRSARLTATRLALRYGANGAPVELDARRWRPGRRDLLRYLGDPTRTA